MSGDLTVAVPRFAASAEAGGVVVTAGLVALTPGTLTPACADFDGQARHVLAQLDALLAPDGGAPLRLLRLECFLADRRWFPRWNAIFADHFGAAPPARTTLVGELVLDGLHIEIQGLAVREEES